MNAIIKFLAVLLIAGGILALVYRSFSCSRETHKATLGTLELTINDKQQNVNIPVWVGAGAIAIGGVLLLFRGRKN